MKSGYSLDNVQLLFPARALDNDMLNILRSPGRPSIPVVGKKRGRLKPIEVQMGIPVKGKDELETVAAQGAGPAIDLSGVELNILGINLGEFLKAFKGLKVEQIELWISGAVESGGILKLAVSTKGEGGIKVVLRPKD